MHWDVVLYISVLAEGPSHLLVFHEVTWRVFELGKIEGAKVSGNQFGYVSTGWSLPTRC